MDITEYIRLRLIYGPQTIYTSTRMGLVFIINLN